MDLDHRKLGLGAVLLSTEWYVIFAASVCGISAGLYWAAEGAIVLAYPEHRKRGRYLAIWLAFKNSGQIVGGSINLGMNIHRSTGGKISYATLLAFVILQVLAVPTAFLISNPEQVQREDGTKVKVNEQTSTREQYRKLWTAITSREMGPLIPIFFSKGTNLCLVGWPNFAHCTFIKVVGSTGAMPPHT
ncbi:hypothetical protein H0H87_007511 [Tephrocybe sp. NHM501043]|nr:hypothetical protein H0H87_007511 [Tephrocybe sp. NHM501043]